jgi:hypothetical protein
MVLELFTLPSVPIYRLGINWLSFRKQRVWASFQAHGRCFREWPILIWRVATGIIKRGRISATPCRK